MQRDWDSLFTDLYRENAPKMFAYALRQLRNRSLAEELAEEAFVRLLQQRDNLTEHPNLKGWLWKTLQHLILTEVKMARYHREIPLEDVSACAAPEEETRDLAEELPPGLSDSEREVLVLFYQEEYTHQEIARRLGISEMNSRTRLFRAKNHCKKLLEKNISACHKTGG